MGNRHAVSVIVKFVGQLASGFWSIVLWAVGFALIFSLGFWGLSIALVDRQAISSQWHAVVEFDFPGVDAGTYPDGSPFVHTDLLSTTLLQRALRQTELGTSLSPEGLRERLTIMPAAPGRNALISQYRERWELAEPAEWAALEQRFLRDLTRQELAQARLVLQLESEQAPALLESIVEQWAEYVIHEAGLFSPGIELYSAHLVTLPTFADADPILIYDRYRTLFELLNHNITALQSEPNIGRARSATEGLSISDLAAQASELRDFGLERLSTLILASDMTSSSSAFIRSLLQQRYQSSDRERQVLLAKVDQVDRAIEQYDFGLPDDVEHLDEAISESLVLGQQPPLDQGVVQQLLRLGRRAADAEFRQALSRERLDYALAATAIAAEKVRLQQLIQNLDRSSAGNPDAVVIGSAADIEQALASIQQDLVRLFVASEELAVALGQLRFGGGSQIYRLDVSDKPISEPLIATPGAVGRFWLLLSLVVLAAVLLVLVRVASGKLRRA